MKSKPNELNRVSVYKTTLFFLPYLLLSLLKIYGQINNLLLFQVIVLIISGIWLAIPFIKKNISGYCQRVLLFFTMLYLGQSIIIFYKDPILLKLGMIFYIFSKIIILSLLEHQHSEITFRTKLDYWKILVPQVVSFGLAYLLYNNSKIDLTLSILIIFYSEMGALLFTYILYLNNLKNQLMIKIGLLFFLFHDIIGGINFFHLQFDSFFILTFSLAASGSFLVGYGFWASKIDFKKRNDSYAATNWFLSVSFVKKLFVEAILGQDKSKIIFENDGYEKIFDRTTNKNLNH